MTFPIPQLRDWERGANGASLPLLPFRTDTAIEQ